MKEISLNKFKPSKNKGLVALVDDEDFEFLNQYDWYAVKSKNTSYVVRNVYLGGKNYKKKRIRMHTEIMKRHGKYLQDKIIDHNDRNGLNNQKSNLRMATNRENMLNSSKRKNCSSKYKGVHFYKPKKRWNARVTVNGKRFYLGSSKDELIAALIYNIGATKYYGEYAVLNCIPIPSIPTKQYLHYS